MWKKNKYLCRLWENSPSSSSDYSLSIFPVFPALLIVNLPNSLKTTQNNKAAFRAVGANHKHPLQILKELSPGLGVQKHFKQTEVNGIFAIDLSWYKLKSSV